MNLRKYRLLKEQLIEVDITELSDMELRFLANDIMLEHSGRRVDSDLAVAKLREISNELYGRLRK